MPPAPPTVAHLKATASKVAVERSIRPIAVVGRSHVGTRVAEPILASVHVRARQQAGHMNASDLIKHCPKALPARPFFSGKPGWVRSSAWIWLFSSTLSTMA